MQLQITRDRNENQPAFSDKKIFDHVIGFHCHENSLAREERKIACEKLLPYEKDQRNA